MKKGIRRRGHKARSLVPSLLPRGKKERRRVELLGGAAVGLFSLTIGLLFAVSGFHQFLLRSPNVAAVISAVLVDLANADRVQNNLGTLSINPVLVMAAQAKANDMATKGYFAHVSPQGIDPWFWFKEVGYKFDYAGENLAVDFSDSGDVNSAWMNSPTHRENLLDSHYTEIGIATAQGLYQGHPTTFVVQEFGKPSRAIAQAPVKAASVPAKPTEIAVASTKPDSVRVLGSSASDAQTAAPAFAISTTEPAVAASLAQDASGGAPWWAFLVGFPRDSLRYAYYLLGALVLIALAVETGLELHRRHTKHAYRAGFLLVLMVVLFVTASTFFFSKPVLASSGAQPAGAAQAL